MRLLTAEGAIASRCEARVKLPSSQMAMNSLRVVRSIRRVMLVLGVPVIERDCVFSCMVCFPIREDIAFEVTEFLKIGGEWPPIWNPIPRRGNNRPFYSKLHMSLLALVNPPNSWDRDSRRGDRT
ncbi:hypothetical protein ABIF64_006373 [Bradyrhizobium japonicum]